MEEEYIYFIDKKTGRIKFKIREKEFKKGIYFSIFFTPIFVVGTILILKELGIIDYIINKAKFVLSFYFG